jgi:hypothetical protein
LVGIHPTVRPFRRPAEEVSDSRWGTLHKGCCEFAARRSYGTARARTASVPSLLFCVPKARRLAWAPRTPPHEVPGSAKFPGQRSERSKPWLRETGQLQPGAPPAPAPTPSYRNAACQRQARRRGQRVISGRAVGCSRSHLCEGRTPRVTSSRARTPRRSRHRARTVPTPRGRPRDAASVGTGGRLELPWPFSHGQNGP